jgi:hypothetical protein
VIQFSVVCHPERGLCFAKECPKDLPPKETALTQTGTETTRTNDVHNSHQHAIPGPKSKALSERRAQAVPRGLSHGTPIYVAKAEDAWLEDVDGNRYIDFAGGIGCAQRRPSPGARRQARSRASSTSSCTPACRSRLTKTTSGSPSG